MEFPEHFCIVFDYPLSNLFSSSKVSNISKQEISFRYADQLTMEDEPIDWPKWWFDICKDFRYIQLHNARWPVKFWWWVLLNCHLTLDRILKNKICVTVLSLLEMHSGGNVRRPRCRPFSPGVLGASDLILIYYWGGLHSAMPTGGGPCSAVLRHLRVANALVSV